VSKGSPSLKVRLPQATIDRIREVIKAQNCKRTEAELTVTDWIQAAIASSLKDFERHRRWSDNKKRQRKQIAQGVAGDALGDKNRPPASVIERQAGNEPAREATGKAD
jgi:hypothetical protein